MRNGYTIIDWNSSSSSRTSTTLCNITGQLSVVVVWKLVTHQINQFLSFHHHYIISGVERSRATVWLRRDEDAEAEMMMDAMVCCISAVEWRLGGKCRLQIKCRGESLWKPEQNLIRCTNKFSACHYFKFSFPIRRFMAQSIASIVDVDPSRRLVKGKKKADILMDDHQLCCNLHNLSVYEGFSALVVLRRADNKKSVWVRN